MFKSALIKTDVTAVKLIDSFVFAGIGNYLNIFTEKGAFLKKIQIFDGYKIHGIHLNSTKTKILLHGGTCLQILEINLNSLELTFSYFTKTKDWILTAQWLKHDQIAIVQMLNKLLICNSNCSQEKEIICGEKCILYSAFICQNENQNSLAVLSGTVFGEILIWKVGQHENLTSPVLVKLGGHNGVIFSLCYNKSAGYICSASDDRSCILWSIKNKCLHKELEKSQPEIHLSKKLYGHQSRIFRSLLTDKFLMTGGEDSIVNVWSFDGNLIRKLPTHQGGPVWALDCQNDRILTGGSDCGVLLSLLDNKLIFEQFQMPRNEIPKRLGFLVGNDLAVITENGGFYYFVEKTKEWKKTGQHDDLKNYNLLEVSNCRNIVSLSGFQGQIYIYKTHKSSLQLIKTVTTNEKTRIYSFHWLTCSTFLACDQSRLTLFSLHFSQPITHFALPSTKDSWTSTACQGPNGLILTGDRKGNIHLFHLGHPKPISTIKKAHNYLGVTHLCYFDGKIISLGRDSTINYFSLGKNNFELISGDKIPFSWLTGLSGHFVYGFQGNSFVVYDLQGRRNVLEHVCGGGHRSSDFYKMTFVYIKDKSVNYVKFDQSEESVDVVGGYHVRTVNSVKVIGFGGRYFVFSGGEDSNFRLSVVGEDEFCHLRTFKSHLSSIRSVWLVEISADESLVFSGGGRGEIICWKFQFWRESLKNCKVSEEFSFYEQTDDELLESEIRIMDLVTFVKDGVLFLFAASSEGKINIFKIEQENGKYKIVFLQSLFKKTKCVTKISVIKIGDFLCLVSMTTDGCLAFWDLKFLPKIENSAPFQEIKIHQSAIVGFSVHILPNNSVIFLTGGDDATFSLTWGHFWGENFTVLGIFKNEGWHCAQVTGTWIGEKNFLTTSIDQKLLIFKWGIGDGTIVVDFLGRYDSAVADIQGMECEETEETFDVFLYGKGLEFVKSKK